MPKQHTFPRLFNELKTVTISLLRKEGYLKPDCVVTGTVYWTRGNERTGTISVKAIMEKGNQCIILDYNYNDKPINYTVQLVSMPSNIGKGVIWYFICPHTRKRCRKLYLSNGYFYHRDAIRGCMYETQTYSQYSRFLCGQYDKLFASDNAYKQLYSKYFTKQYNGKPTKKYLRILKQIADGEGISEEVLLLS